MKTVEIDGKRYFWTDILKARREQKKAQRQNQLTLFELKIDARPASQHSAEGRLLEPLLFSDDHSH